MGALQLEVLIHGPVRAVVSVATFMANADTSCAEFETSGARADGGAFQTLVGANSWAPVGNGVTTPYGPIWLDRLSGALDVPAVPVVPDDGVLDELVEPLAGLGELEVLDDPLDNDAPPDDAGAGTTHTSSAAVAAATARANLFNGI